MGKASKRNAGDIALDRKIGATLAFIRNREASQTQEEFAKGFGITLSRLANIESGRTPLPAFVGWDVCDTFNVHPTWLCKGGDFTQSRMPDDIPTKAKEVIRESFKALGGSPFREVWPSILWMLKQSVNQDFFQLQNTEITITRKLSVDTKKGGDKVGIVSSEKIPTWKELVTKLKTLTQESGAKVKLASDLKTSRQNVNKWLSGTGMPSAELTLAVYRWVKEHE